MKLACPRCGQLLELPDASAGKRGKCPACQAVFLIPDSGAESSPGTGLSDLLNGGLGEVSGATGPQATASGTGPWSQQGIGGGFIPDPETAMPGALFPPSAGIPPVGQASLSAADAPPVASVAKSKLLGPAIGLIVAAGVNLLIIAGRLALGGIDLPPPPPDADPSYVAGYQIGAKAVIGAILLGGITNMVTLLGGVMMLRLKMRALAVTGAILAMVPCLSCCWPLGLGMGIWALVALNDPTVRSAFT